MKKALHKHIVLFSLGLMAVATLICGFFFWNNPQKVVADGETTNSIATTENIGEIYSEEAFCDGASIRLVEDGKSGIRFHVRVLADSYLGNNINSLQTGMLVIPTDKLGGVDLTHANTINQKTPFDAKAADKNTSGKWNLTVDEGVSYMESLVYVYNIPEDSYDRGFTFRGYVKYNENYYYTATPESRSITYVAMKANHAYNTQGETGAITYTPSQLTVLGQYSPLRTAISDNLVNVSKYYYRVGNQNTVPFDNLFREIDVHTDIANVNISVGFETVQGTATGTYTDGNFKFSNTGYVKISVLDTYSRRSTNLVVEVVDGLNITSSEVSTGSTNTNVVLLNDVKISSGGYVVYNNCTVYGNGFTFDISGGKIQFAKDGGSEWGIIKIMNNAKLDNLVIIGSEYKTFATTSNTDYNTVAVYSVSGTIQNCYIEGCASPVMTETGTTTITNTTLYGGAVANLQLKGGATILKDVTTVNYNDGRKLIGLGIVARDDIKSGSTLTIKEGFKQYNFVSSTDGNNDDTLKELYSYIFKSSQIAYHFNYNETTYANTGIVSMSESEFNDSNITNESGNGYSGMKVKIQLWYYAYVYTQPNTVGEVDNNYVKETDEHIASVQGGQKLPGQSDGVWTPPSIMG